MAGVPPTHISGASSVALRRGAGVIDESSRKGNDISDELEESEPLADLVSVVYPVAAAAGCGCTCRHGLRQPTFCFSATAFSFCARGPLEMRLKARRKRQVCDGVGGVGGTLQMSLCRGVESDGSHGGEGSGSEADVKDATSHGRRKGAVEAPPKPGAAGLARSSVAGASGGGLSPSGDLAPCWCWVS